MACGNCGAITETRPLFSSTYEHCLVCDGKPTNHTTDWISAETVTIESLLAAGFRRAFEGYENKELRENRISEWAESAEVGSGWPTNGLYRVTKISSDKTRILISSGTFTRTYQKLNNEWWKTEGDCF